MLKILSILLSLFLGFTGANRVQSIERVSLRTFRRFLILTLGALSTLVLFTAGLSLVLVDLVLTSRSVGFLAVSSLALVGWVLIGLSVLSTLAVFSKTFWRIPQEAPARPSAELNQLFADLLQALKESRPEPAPAPKRENHRVVGM